MIEVAPRTKGEAPTVNLGYSEVTTRLMVDISIGLSSNFSFGGHHFEGEMWLENDRGGTLKQRCGWNMPCE